MSFMAGYSAPVRLPCHTNLQEIHAPTRSVTESSFKIVSGSTNTWSFDHGQRDVNAHCLACDGIGGGRELRGLPVPENDGAVRAEIAEHRHAGDRGGALNL